MRHQLASLAATATLLCNAAGASILDFKGTLEISYGSATVSWNTVSVATVNSGGPGLAVTRLQIPAGAFFGTRTTSFTTSTPTLSGLSATALRVSLVGNGDADWVRGTPMGNLGAMPLVGELRLCLLGGCASPVDLDLNVAAVAPLSVPDAVPIGTTMNPSAGLAIPLQLPLRTLVGTHTVSTSTPPPGLVQWHLPGSMSISVMTIKAVHKPMTTWTFSIMMADGGFTRSFVGSFDDGFAAGPLANSSTVAQAGGVIQMVRPFAIVGASTGGAVGTVRTTVEFLPEPLMGLSLSWGALLLLWLGARRQR